MTSPTPFPLHTVLYFLQYISPLDGPVPRHLISDSLFQRHQFLQLTPDDPYQYLCWPTEHEGDSETVMNILNKYSFGLQDDDVASSGIVRYTHDGDFMYAHVHLKSIDQDDMGVRFIFQWSNNLDTNDVVTGWRYHDIKLMPFPVDSCGTINEIMAHPVFNQDDGDDLDNDCISYRNYAPEKSAVDEHIGGEFENTYWAKYASVEESVISVDDSSEFSKLQQSRDSALTRSSSLLSLTRSQYSGELEDFTLPAESSLTGLPLANPTPKQLVQHTGMSSLSSPPFHDSEDNTTVSSQFFTSEERQGVCEMIKGAFTIWSSLARHRGRSLSFEGRRVEFMKIVDDAIQNE